MKGKKLLARFESPRKPLWESRQRTEEASQRRSIDFESEVDEFVEGELDWGKRRALSTLLHVPCKSLRQRRSQTTI